MLPQRFFMLQAAALFVLYRNDWLPFILLDGQKKVYFSYAAFKFFNWTYLPFTLIRFYRLRLIFKEHLQLSLTGDTERFRKNYDRPLWSVSFDQGLKITVTILNASYLYMKENLMAKSIKLFKSLNDLEL